MNVLDNHDPSDEMKRVEVNIQLPDGPPPVQAPLGFQVSINTAPPNPSGIVFVLNHQNIVDIVAPPRRRYGWQPSSNPACSRRAGDAWVGSSGGTLWALVRSALASLATVVVVQTGPPVWREVLFYSRRCGRWP